MPSLQQLLSWRPARLLSVVFVCLFAPPLSSGSPAVCAAENTEPACAETPPSGDALVHQYFRQETARLAEQSLRNVNSLEEWEGEQKQARRQLFEMLGLDPQPPKTDLKPVVTGIVEHDDYVVERLHFQSRPGLYVTGNLYRPRQQSDPLPAILYVCGHGGEREGGVSLGNKTHYRHHGAWFARNGYVCLTIDTLQLGEIEGIHHGTYGIRSGGDFIHRWWWNSHGYTPAGVEAWNCIRALDYLETRPEVDAKRFGVTGRSGGGAYSWWIAALDQRIACAVPVAGITDLENHVVDGCVTGHCDCMYMVNTYRWDYAQVAALVAPRPLLISNTDKDRIFPLEGVVRLHAKVRKIYRLYGKAGNLGLQITEGPHLDTQELRVHAFHWFNRFLKNDRSLIEKVAVPLDERRVLRVFEELPADQKNTEIDQTFVTLAKAKVPEDASSWNQMRDGWLQGLKEKSFRGWPSEPESLDVKQCFTADNGGITLSKYEFASQSPYRLPLYVAHRAGLKKFDLVVLNVLDEAGWKEFQQSYAAGFQAKLGIANEGDENADGAAFKQLQGMFKSFAWAMAYVPPRGVGPTAWDDKERNVTHNRRRFMLLGQTLDGMQVWDATRAVAALRETPNMPGTQLWMQGEDKMAGVALYASLFTPDVHRIDLHRLPKSHHDRPQFLNVLRVLDMPQAVALAAEKTQVRLYQDQKPGWEYPQDLVERLNWDKKQLQVRTPRAAN